MTTTVRARWDDETRRTVLIDRGGAVSHAPADPDNTDYAALLAAGAEIEPSVPPAPLLPDQVDLWRMHAALKRRGLFETAEAAIAASGDVALACLWTMGAAWPRRSRAQAALAKALRLGAEEMDAVFAEAAMIAI